MQILHRPFPAMRLPISAHGRQIFFAYNHAIWLNLIPRPEEWPSFVPIDTVYV